MAYRWSFTNLRVSLLVLWAAVLLEPRPGTLTAARPLDDTGGLTSTAPAARHRQAPTHSCMRHLHHRIERCLNNYEQLLTMFRDESVSPDQRTSMRPKFCHQYLVTLQCLHEVLDQCPAQPEHLDLIERRLGHLRGFMHRTCTAGPEPATPTLLPPTGSSTTPQEVSTATPLMDSGRGGGEVHTHTPLLTESTQPTTSGLSTQSTSSKKNIRGSTPLPGNPEAVSKLATDVTTARLTSKKRTTSHLSVSAEMKLQLLFGDQMRETTGSNSEIHSQGLIHETFHKQLIPILAAATEKNSENSLIKARAEKQVNCNVDDQGRIDIRCIFSGSSLPTLSLPTILIALITLRLTAIC